MYMFLYVYVYTYVCVFLCAFVCFCVYLFTFFGGTDSGNSCYQWVNMEEVISSGEGSITLFAYAHQSTTFFDSNGVFGSASAGEWL